MFTLSEIEPGRRFRIIKTPAGGERVTIELVVIDYPIPMVLHCPRCGTQHIDEPNEAKGWTNPPHRSHECQHCGAIWRPSDLPTTGVAAITTRGKADWYFPAPL